MYHRSVALSNSLNPRPQRQSFLVQNENALNTTKIKNSKNSVTFSTPNQPQNRPSMRRAFGDISNAKGQSSSNNKPTNNSGIPTLKKQSKGILTPSTRSNIPKLNTKLTNKKQTPSKLKPPSSRLSASSQKLSSSSILPSRNTNTSENPQTKLVPTTKVSANIPAISSSLDPVDDVELPAGRTFLQQQMNGDDDDDFSTSSIGEFQVQTMWDDWEASLTQQRNLDEEEDKKVQEHIDRVMREQNDGTFSSLRNIPESTTMTC